MMKHSLRKHANLGVVLFTAAVSIWLVGCAGGESGGSNSLYPLSVTHVKALNLGVLMYINDYDDALPLAGKWMDEILPYTKDTSINRSPAVATKGYGYAFNSAITGQSLPTFADPSLVVTIFDSNDLSFNATDPTSTEPHPMRYGNRNTIGYLDGHVQDEGRVTGSPTLYQQSQTRLKQLNLGMTMYANDYDGALPVANQWVDELKPYVKEDLLFHSPLVQLKNPALYGFALNTDVAGQLVQNILSPSTTISLFDSTVLTKNATAPTSTLPQPPRYGTHNTIGYVDGHVAN